MSRRVMAFVGLAIAVLMIPTVAFAAAGSFTSGSSSTPAVKGVNSASGGKGVHGAATSSSSTTHYGVYGGANGSGGIGVFGSGPKYGVYSSGHLGLAGGKLLKCSRCVTPGATASTPAARVYNSTGSTVATDTETPVTFDTELFDNAGLHSTTTNTDRLTASITGIYQVSAGSCWNANSVGTRLILIYKNGSFYNEAIAVPPSGAADYFACENFSQPIDLAAGDYITIRVMQSSGDNLGLLGGNDRTWLAMTYVSA